VFNVVGTTSSQSFKKSSDGGYEVTSWISDRMSSLIMLAASWMMRHFSSTGSWLLSFVLYFGPYLCLFFSMLLQLESMCTYHINNCRTLFESVDRLGFHVFKRIHYKTHSILEGIYYRQFILSGKHVACFRSYFKQIRVN